MNEMSKADMCWLTGMSEGEASFSTTSAGNQAKAGYRYPIIEIKSIDLEVIERIQRITGIGQIAVENRSINHPTHQTCWMWRVTNARDVLDVICIIASYGFLSDHRKFQVTQLIGHCSSILKRKHSGESYRRIQTGNAGFCQLENCNNPLINQSKQAKYCSSAHKQKAFRARNPS